MLRIIVGSLIAFACVAAHAQKMEPGQWEFTSSTSAPGLKKPHTR